MVNRVACPRIRPKLFSLTVKKFLYLVVAGSLLVLFCRATVWNNGEADWSRNGKFDNNYHSIDSKTICHVSKCLAGIYSRLNLTLLFTKDWMLQHH